MIKLILFDYDGVIVDSFPTIYNVYRIMVKELGIKKFPATLEEFRQIYGRNYRKCYENLGISADKYEQAGQIFKREVVKQKPKLFAGIDNVIKELSKKYKLVIVSANHKEEVEQKLKKKKLTQYFSFISGIDTAVNPNFKKAEIYGNILKKYNVSVDEVIVIGDRDIDVDNAREAGIDNVLIVNYGWGHSGTNLQPHEINIPQEIISAIRKIDC